MKNNNNKNSRLTDKAILIKDINELRRIQIEILDEIALLSQIKKRDPKGTNYVVQLVDHFPIYGPDGRHICLVFETLGRNLLSLIKQHEYQGIPITHVKIITKQILVGLNYLHSKCKIIH